MSTSSSSESIELVLCSQEEVAILVQKVLAIGEAKASLEQYLTNLVIDRMLLRTDLTCGDICYCVLKQLRKSVMAAEVARGVQAAISHSNALRSGSLKEKETAQRYQNRRVPITQDQVIYLACHHLHFAYNIFQSIFESQLNMSVAKALEER